ncbi:MAG: von Willebrand factor type domain protein [Gemmataceae bacterium]|nr:von Willebrand factor type domain protein [Gemmataceae bacterium]
MSLALRLLAYLAAAAVPLLPAAPLLAADAKPDPARPAEAKPAEGKAIDLVLCLDVSGSMNGLIDSAKIKLWDIVNELARLKPTPNLRVALYSYGHSTYPQETGWVRKDVDLTADLDDVYKALNALTINGGTEFVARVTNTALADQKWSTDAGALKLIFVCGNEPADQDKQVGLDDVAARAKKNGVVVNTIYCGRANHPEAAGWAAFAEKCGGRYVNIDQNKTTNQVAVKTEFDAEILKLNDELNKTYVAYGKGGKDRAANQLAQDVNAAKAPAAPGPGGAPAAPVAALARAESKAGALYRNSAWDLVDRMKDDKTFDLKKVKEEDLPDELKKLTPDERVEYVKKKTEERAGIQKKIGDLAAKRQKKVDEEVAKQPRTDTEKALDEAVKGVVRDQARGKGFETPAEKK